MVKLVLNNVYLSLIKLIFRLKYRIVLIETENVNNLLPTNRKRPTNCDLPFPGNECLY